MQNKHVLLIKKQGGSMKDPLLVSLIILAESDPPKELDAPMEIDITLIVGGFLVSGYVISTKKYMQHHSTTAAISKAVEMCKDENLKTEEKSYDYIHLRDAKYYVPGSNPIPGNMGVFVRIPLESVQGFSFGKLNIEKE